MEFYKRHRRYPDVNWDYKAISTKMVDEQTYRLYEVIYYTIMDHGKKKQGVEIYLGPNYIVGSDGRSYSRRYSLREVPSKYKSIVNELMRIHKSTTWSKEKYVNLN